MRVYAADVGDDGGRVSCCGREGPSRHRGPSTRPPPRAVVVACVRGLRPDFPGPPRRRVARRKRRVTHLADAHSASRKRAFPAVGRASGRRVAVGRRVSVTLHDLLPQDDRARRARPKPPARGTRLLAGRSAGWRAAYDEHGAARLVRDPFADAAKRFQPSQPAAPGDDEISRLRLRSEHVEAAALPLLELGRHSSCSVAIDLIARRGDDAEVCLEAARHGASGAHGELRLGGTVDAHHDRLRPRLWVASRAGDEDRAGRLVQHPRRDRAEQDAGGTPLPCEPSASSVACAASLRKTVPGRRSRSCLRHPRALRSRDRLLRLPLQERGGVRSRHPGVRGLSDRHGGDERERPARSSESARPLDRDQAFGGAVDAANDAVEDAGPGRPAAAHECSPTSSGG